MYRFYQKSELNFSLAWIIAYVVLSILADQFSASLGVAKLVTAPLLLLLSLVLFGWIQKHGLSEKHGLCLFRGNLRDYLYFLPLLLLLATNMRSGFALNGSVPESVLFVLSMLCVGFLEEVIFRGLLFKALCRDSVRQAVLISSLTFGMGHIVNLLNGRDFLPTLLQVCYATAIGFLFTVLFYRGGSLWPCIVTHGVFNSLSGFGGPVSQTNRLVGIVVLCALSLGYALWILKKTKPAGSLS